ncbi:unnamed protein product [Alopecurus aequalis]
MAPSAVPLLILLLSVVSASTQILDGLELGVGGDGLHREILRDETVLRLKELGKISDGEGFLERTFLSPASIRATHVIISWMEDAGLATWVDQMGNIHGRFEPSNSTDKALLIGSHMDTVIDAGMYDGALGIICAISALKVLKVTGKLQRLTRPVEVIAFSDEEGVRFQTTFLGSAAVAGILPESILQVSDKSGTTVEDVLKLNSFEATAGALGQVKYSPESVGSYVEVHLEQGPVLEALRYPLGVVKGIAGQTRLKVVVDGSQGHAGTVPMKLRRDPMVAAAELVVTLESLCKDPSRFLTYEEECGCFTEESLGGLVCTVGELLTWPSASNVIPGQVNFTVDIRAMDDVVRETIVASFSRIVLQRCDDRLVDCAVEHKASCTLCWCVNRAEPVCICVLPALCAGHAVRPGADDAAGACDAVGGVVDDDDCWRRPQGQGRVDADACADERRGARRDGDGAAEQGGDGVRAVPGRGEPLARGARGGGRRVGRRAGAAPVRGSTDGGRRAVSCVIGGSSTDWIRRRKGLVRPCLRSGGLYIWIWVPLFPLGQPATEINGRLLR